MASTSGGTVLSMELIGANPSFSSQPHWKTITKLPYAAATDNTVIRTPLNAKNTDWIEISSITKAISATKTNTHGWVLDTSSSKSLISAVGPPILTCADPAPAAGRWPRSHAMVLRAPRSSGSTDSTPDTMALLLLSANTGVATEMRLGAWPIS